MALVSNLSTIDATKTGNMKFTVLDIDLSAVGTTVYSPPTHPGWLLCNSATLSNTGVYTSLYSYLGTKYGAAGQLPDGRNGRTPIPKGATYFTSEGATGGEATHLITIGEIPSHQHSLYMWWLNFNPTYNPYEDEAGAICYQQYSQHGTNVVRPGGGFDSTPHSNPIDGFDSPHENMFPYQVVGALLIKL